MVARDSATTRQSARRPCCSRATACRRCRRVAAAAAIVLHVPRDLRRQQACAAGRGLPRVDRLGCAAARALALSSRDRSGRRRHGVPLGPRGSAGRRLERRPMLRGERGRRGLLAGRWSAQVSTMACIDPKRVYAVGFSMGGGMAHYLACHAADVFAAVAPSAFDLLQENVGDCRPARPITVISFRGSADNLVPYDGGPSAVVPGMPVTFLGAQATFQKWAEHRPVHRAAVGARQRTDARPTPIARAASRWCCARSRAAARKRAMPASPGRCSSGTPCRSAP